MGATRRTQCVLEQDGDCHWYILPTDKRREWSVWLESDDGCLPEFAVAIDGPHQVSFEWEVPDA